jgi:hypothetical protein
MNIGDIFLRLVAQDAGFEKQVIRAGEQAGTKAGQSLGAKLKAALTPGNLLAGFGVGLAVAKVTDFLGDAVHAAREENAAIATLTQSIHANDLAWDGNIDRIEEVIDKRQDLAFADDEQRASLQRLVSVTKDVNKALELQRTAMDLARLRGMDLATASDLIGKVYAGNLGTLSRYGIVLEEGATATEALAEIQRRAAGQAEAFARTEAGLADRFAIAIDNRVEAIGQKLLPVIAELTEFLLDEGIPALDQFIELLDFDNPQSAQDIPILGEIEDFLNSVDDAGIVFGDMLRFQESAVRRWADVTGQSYLAARREVAAAAEGVTKDWDAVVDQLVEEPRLTNLGQFVAENLGGTQVDAAAREMADGIPQAMEDAKAQAEEIARQTPGALASQLRDSIDDYDAALEELATVAQNSVSDLAERQKIEGILASRELTEALNSDSTRTRLLALDLVNDLIADYELLAPGALDAGRLVNPAMADGLRTNLRVTRMASEAIVDAAGNPLVDLPGMAFTSGFNTAKEFASGLTVGKGLVVDAAAGLAASARSQIAINSEPEDPNSPLSGVTTWGGNLVKTWVADIYRHLGLGRSAARALAGTVTPPLIGAGGGPRPLEGNGAQGAGSGDQYLQLVVNGERRTVRSADDLWRGWQSMAGFADG